MCMQIYNRTLWCSLGCQELIGGQLLNQIGQYLITVRVTVSDHVECFLALQFGSEFMHIFIWDFISL